MPVINSGVAYYIGDTPVQKLYAGAVHVWPQIPKITSVSPTEYHHADGVTEMTINGTGFLPTSQVLLNGVVQNQFTYVSSTQVKANVDPANTGTADLSWPVIVRNPPNSDSNTVNVTVVLEPTLTSISPTSRITTDPVTTITLTGTNFTPECRVKAGTGNMDASTYVNRTTMTCRGGWNVTGTHQINVVDEKNHKTVDKPFTVNAPPPPPLAVTAANGFIDQWQGGTIYLTGTNFKAPMTMNVGASFPNCDINENWAKECTVISPTEATSWWGPATMDGHYSTASPDNTHNVRVITPDGTSPWCNNQPVTFS